MPSKKTKKLLEGLGKITDSAPKPFQNERVNSYTNRYYPNTINILPARYGKARRKKDEDGDEYIAQRNVSKKAKMYRHTAGITHAKCGPLSLWPLTWKPATLRGSPRELSFMFRQWL